MASINDIRVDKKFVTYFLNAFFGRIKRFSGEFLLWGFDMINRGKKVFLFIPNKESLPGDIKVKSFLNYFKRVFRTSKENFREITADLEQEILNKTFAEIDAFNKARVLLKAVQMKKSPVIIFDNIAKGIRFEDFQKIKPIILGFKEDDCATIFHFSDESNVLLGDNPNEWRAFSLENGEYYDIFRKKNGK